MVGKKGKMMERRILKDFQIGEIGKMDRKSISFTFKYSQSMRRKSVLKKKKKDWNSLVRQHTQTVDPIGRSRMLKT